MINYVIFTKALSLSGYRDIPPKDEFGGDSDPYVKCYFRIGEGGKDFKFHQTDVIDNAKTASFEKIPFENYQRGTNQWFHFRVKDHDTITGDDDLGEAFMNIDSFVDGRKPAKFTLPENATLIVSMNRNF